MSIHHDLPRLVDHGRHVRASLPPLQVVTARDLVPRTLHGAAVWRIDDDGQVEGQRRDTLGPTWHRLTPALVRDWARELGIGGDPSDPYAPRVTDSADVAEQIADEVAALVRAAPTGTRPLSTLSPAAALARRLVSAFELLPDGDRLRWRLRYADPVRGGPGPLPPPPEDAAPVPAGLRPWRRATPERDPGEVVTAAEVERVVRTAGYLTAHDPAPSYPDVVVELRALAGLPSAPAAPGSVEESGATGWLRRRAAGRPTP